MAKTSDIYQFINVGFIGTIDGWYFGNAMGQKYEVSTLSMPWGTKAYREALVWFELLSELYPIKPKPLYRLISPKLIDVEVGQTLRLKTSVNVIQSWTDTSVAAEQFFKDAYKNKLSSQRSYLIVKANLGPMTTTAVVRKLLEWMLKNGDRLPELTEDPLWQNKATAKQMLKWIASLLRRIDSKMIKSQREHIVYVPKPLKIAVAKVLA